MDLPDKAKALYQEKLTEATALIADSLAKITHDLAETLESNTHDLAGVAGYFEDTQIATSARKINAYIKDSPDAVSLNKDASFKGLLADLENAVAGSRFLATPDKEGAHPTASKSKINTLVLVDDDPLVHAIFKPFLEAHNLDIISFENVKETIKFLKKNRPDIIVSDLHMPDVTGLNLLEFVNSDTRLKSIPLIFMTGSKDDAIFFDCLAKGAKEFLQKPVEPEDLLDIINRFSGTGIKKILVVEDDLFMHHIFEANLPKHAFKLTFEADGNQVSKKLTDDDFDMIILDRMLPGKDGLSVLIELKGKKSSKDLPILICSAKNSDAQIKEVFDNGADDFVSKPIKFEELLFRINRLLN
ncbi:MAG: DNA-binding response OmpR family regulator [Candidatus Marinamargulisbacteria bacterium]|jgi:DNA-binding response OmpR family regulator